MTRSANAVWNGGLKTGNGRLSTPNRFLSDAPYSFVSRFDTGEGGTNPEEMIAAAHAGCFSMALAANMEKAGFPPESVTTTCAVTLGSVDGVPTITNSDLKTVVVAPGIEDAQFQEIAAETRKGCPVSRVLNLEISLEATLG